MNYDLSPVLHTTEHYANVKLFMQKAQQRTPSGPGEPSAETRVLRARLIYEEAMETINALGVVISVDAASTGPEVRTVELNSPQECEVTSPKFAVTEVFNLQEIADGCADIKVVTTGTLIACGLPDHAIQQLVDQNNLAKFGPGHRIDEGGKLIKPPNHQPPDIAGLLFAIEKQTG